MRVLRAVLNKRQSGVSRTAPGRGTPPPGSWAGARRTAARGLRRQRPMRTPRAGGGGGGGRPVSGGAGRSGGVPGDDGGGRRTCGNCMTPRPQSPGAVLKTENKGFVTPTETSVHSDALCFTGKTWAKTQRTGAEQRLAVADPLGLSLRGILNKGSSGLEGTPAKNTEAHSLFGCQLPFGGGLPTVVPITDTTAPPPRGCGPIRTKHRLRRGPPGTGPDPPPPARARHPSRHCECRRGR